MITKEPEFDWDAYFRNEALGTKDRQSILGFVRTVQNLLTTGANSWKINIPASGSPGWSRWRTTCLVKTPEDCPYNQLQVEVALVVDGQTNVPYHKEIVLWSIQEDEQLKFLYGVAIEPDAHLLGPRRHKLFVKDTQGQPIHIYNFRGQSSDPFAPPDHQAAQLLQNAQLLPISAEVLSYRFWVENNFCSDFASLWDIPQKFKLKSGLYW